MQDAYMTVQQLRDKLHQFVDERDWHQFHSPKNLSMALAIEAAELMEHFQWVTVDESRELAADPEVRDAVADEIADVLCYVLALANTWNIDVSETMLSKLEKNAQKYPAEKYRGRYR